MKLSDNKTRKIEFRISEEDFKYLKCGAYTMGQTISSMFRLLAQTTVNAVKAQEREGKINVDNVVKLYDENK